MRKDRVTGKYVGNKLLALLASEKRVTAGKMTICFRGGRMKIRQQGIAMRNSRLIFSLEIELRRV